MNLASSSLNPSPGMVNQPVSTSTSGSTNIIQVGSSKRSHHRRNHHSSCTSQQKHSNTSDCHQNHRRKHNSSQKNNQLTSSGSSSGSGSSSCSSASNNNNNNNNNGDRNSRTELEKIVTDQEAREERLQKATLYRELLPSNLIMSSLMQENDRRLKAERRKGATDEKRLTSSFDSAITLENPFESDADELIQAVKEHQHQHHEHQQQHQHHKHQQQHQHKQQQQQLTYASQTNEPILTTSNQVNETNSTSTNQEKPTSVSDATGDEFGADFRHLLYNMICSLLTQEDEILKSHSVTNIIKILDKHLNGAHNSGACTHHRHSSHTIATTASSSSNHFLLGQTEPEKLSIESNGSSTYDGDGSVELASNLGQKEQIKEQEREKKSEMTTTMASSMVRSRQPTLNVSSQNLMISIRHSNQIDRLSHQERSRWSFDHKVMLLEVNQTSGVGAQNHYQNYVTMKQSKVRQLQQHQKQRQQFYSNSLSSPQMKPSTSKSGSSSISQSKLGGRRINMIKYDDDDDEDNEDEDSYDEQDEDVNGGDLSDQTSDSNHFENSLAAQLRSTTGAQSNGYLPPDLEECEEQDFELDEEDEEQEGNNNKDSELNNDEDQDDEDEYAMLSFFSEKAPYTPARRRNKLEWCLNKLIDYEMKCDWLKGTNSLKHSIRKSGIPSAIRDKVWFMLIDQTITDKYNAKELLSLAERSLNEQSDESDIGSIIKQIDLDVNRTMPGHKLFDEGAEGGTKLRLILAAYSIHVNRAIAYCQGFNFIVALLLSIFGGDEQKSLLGFICIVDHIFPSKFYFDHYLTGARADQYLLADLIDDQLMKNSSPDERKMIEGVTSSITLNWFISLFHGAVPTMTRLIILDHFMLEGVKALFKFTMAILYLSFQQTPPSSSEVFMTIRNTAKNMHDIKLLLSIVNQIKLPKDSYFAIRRSFYMIQSSFSSDQFYMQAISSDQRSSQLAKQPPALHHLGGGAWNQATAPAMSFVASAALAAANLGIQGAGQYGARLTGAGSSGPMTNWQAGPRVCVSLNRSKICIQNIGKLGRSHIKLIDANVKSYERSLMNPLRNCYVIGVANCGKRIIMARQTSRKYFKSFHEQDLLFHVHEINSEIFDGFYMEDKQIIVIITKLGEIIKIDTSKVSAINGYHHQATINSETLMLKDFDTTSWSSNNNTGSGQQQTLGLASCDHAGGGAGPGGSGSHETKIKIEQASLDSATNLLWVYLETEHLQQNHQLSNVANSHGHLMIPSKLMMGSGTGAPDSSIHCRQRSPSPFSVDSMETGMANNNNDHMNDSSSNSHHHRHSDQRSSDSPPIIQTNSTHLVSQRKIILVDVATFDIFSAFYVHPNFGHISKLRTSLTAICQLTNPMSNQFSSRIVKVGPTGRYEHLLSFSDVVDFIVTTNSNSNQTNTTNILDNEQQQPSQSTNGADKTRYAGTLPARLSSTLPLTASSNWPKTIQRPTTADNSEPSGSKPSRVLQFMRESISPFTRLSSSIMSQQQEQSQQQTRDEDEDQEQQHKTKNFSRFSQYKNRTIASKLDTNRRHSINGFCPLLTSHINRALLASYIDDMDDLLSSKYLPLNIIFIFKNGKIALFEFTENYAIHTRESQLDRYDYSRVIDVTRSGDDFVVTILTIFDKLIKIVI